MKRRNVFETGNVLPVEINGKMRLAKIIFVANAQIGLESCDSEEHFKSVKNKTNWNKTGQWTGEGPYATFAAVVKKFLI